MLMLLMAVTTSWAFGPGETITDMSALREGDYVFIKNVGRGKYAYENPGNRWIGHGAEATDLTYAWQVHIEEGGKYSFSSVMGYYIPTPLDGKAMYTVEATDEKKDEFTFTAHPEDNTKWLVHSTNDNTIYWDGQDAQFVGWRGNGANSRFDIIAVDVTTDEINAYIDSYYSTLVNNARNAAIAEVELLATEPVIFPAATETVTSINAVPFTGTTEAEANEAIAAINALVVAYKTNAYKALEGKYYTLFTPGRSGYAKMTANGTGNAASVGGPEFIWQFVENNGSVNIYNPYIGKYLVMNGTNAMNVTANANDASAFDIEIASKPADGNAKVGFISNGWYIHLNGSLLGWYSGGASEWQVTPVGDFSSIIEAYKATVFTSMDEWKNLSVVFDASLIENAKAAINAIKSTDYATFAAIDAEIKKVTDAVAAKMFTFQTLATETNRKNYWVSAGNAGKAIGTANQDYSSIWSLIHAGGVSFYMYNELNQVYMGAPSANCPLTETPSVAYTFEIIDAENGVVEMKCNGETLHVGNDGDGKLLNYDYDETASRWYIRTIDVAADIQTILNGLTEDDYADVPALGQYTTAAYKDLVAARTNAKTVEEVEAAIAAFKKAKNRPVFTISGPKDYVVGKSMYEDEGNTNAKGNDLYFKTTNKYDKTMWWVFDQTATTVGVTESVAVVNYATGNPVWGVENLKITETTENVADDNIFLFYTVGNDTPLHFQSDGAVMTRWNSKDKNSGSAVTFTYIGNTYDLDKLTDDKIAALAALQAAYNAKAFYAGAEMGDGLGQYKGDKDAIVTALAAAEVIGSKTLAQQATLNIADIKAATDALNNVAALVINMPAAGKYYRIQGACEAAEGYENFYITGHTNDDGGRIALTKEADASTIYYFDGTNLIAYQSGLVIGLNNGHWTFASIDDNSKPASTITFAQSPRTAGAYTVKSADRYLHYFYYSVNNTVQVNRCQYDVCKEHDWYLTEVTELPVTVTNAGYATFYAPVAVSVPSGVTAHTVTINGEWATLSEAMNVVPANTGVVLVGEGSYDFAITTAAAFEGTNLMAGTVAKTLVTKPENTECYVLAKPEGAEVAGMYKAAIGEDATKFYNAGHKAYLAVDANKAQGVKSYSIGFGDGTTGVEDVVVENEVKAIYDLTGRRVEAITAAGIYIVNGKKVLVK